MLTTGMISIPMLMLKPSDDPAPRGNPMRITLFVDADHACDKVTCQSVSGILILVNNT